MRELAMRPFTWYTLRQIEKINARRKFAGDVLAFIILLAVIGGLLLWGGT